MLCVGTLRIAGGFRILWSAMISLIGWSGLRELNVNLVVHMDPVVVNDSEPIRFENKW